MKLFEQFNRDEHLRYSPAFEELMDAFVPVKGGGRSERIKRGKVFNSKYEFYIYSFFIGFYLQRQFELDNEGKTFWQFKRWPQQEEYKKVMFIYLLNRNLEDFYELETMEEEEKSKFIYSLFKEAEKYANGGMEYLKEKKNKEPEFFDDPSWSKKLFEESKTIQNNS